MAKTETPYGTQVETYDEYGDSWHVTLVIGTQCENESHAIERLFEREPNASLHGYDCGPGRAFAHPAWLHVEPFVGWVYSQSGGLDI